MNEEIIKELKRIARRKCFYDYECPNVSDYAGGDVGYAFSLGDDAGGTMLARRLLTTMNIKWTE